MARGVGGNREVGTGGVRGVRNGRMGFQWFQWFQCFQWFQDSWKFRFSCRAGGSRNGFRASATGSRCGSRAVAESARGEEATNSPDLDHEQSPIPKLAKMPGWLSAALPVQLCLTLSVPRMIANNCCWLQLKKNTVVNSRAQMNSHKNTCVTQRQVPLGSDVTYRLRQHVGFNPAMREAVLMHPKFQPMVALAIEAVRKALVVDNFTESPEALRLGTHQVVLYCNAGRHRSVAAALGLASEFRIIGWQVVVSHYEKDTWNESCRKGECLSCGEQPRDVWGSLPF